MTQSVRGLTTARAILMAGAMAGLALATATPGLAQAPVPAPVPDDAGEPMAVLTLPAAIDAAEAENIDVVTARLAIRTAQANLRAADTAPNPVLGINGAQIRPDMIGRTPARQLADTVVRVDVPLERGGKRRARVAAARANVTAAEDDLGDTRRQMREAVTNAFYTLKAAEERLAALRTIAASYTEGQRVAGLQRQQGALSEGDFVRQKVEALRADTDARQAILDRQDAQLQLAILIGREPLATTLATAGAWPMPVTGPQIDAATLAARRPDVLAATARIEAARRNLDGAHALRHPDITVGAQYESAPGSLGVGDTVGVGISIPLPVRNRYRGEVDAASTAVVQAEADARKALAVATAEITAARRTVAESTRRLQLIEGTQLPAATRAADVAEFAYKHGATTLLDLLDARRSLQAVQLGAIDARSAEAAALAKLRSVETTGVE